MTQIINSLNILGKWTITVNTPFGQEQYMLNIETANSVFCGSMSHEKGSVPFNNATFHHNTFHCSAETEYPIEATVSLTADLIEDNKITGTIEVGQYLITSFVGVK
jgi:hypothetical protein